MVMLSLEKNIRYPAGTSKTKADSEPVWTWDRFAHPLGGIRKPLLPSHGGEHLPVPIDRSPQIYLLIAGL